MNVLPSARAADREGIARSLPTRDRTHDEEAETSPSTRDVGGAPRGRTAGVLPVRGREFLRLYRASLNEIVARCPEVGEVGDDFLFWPESLLHFQRG